MDDDALKNTMSQMHAMQKLMETQMQMMQLQMQQSTANSNTETGNQMALLAYIVKNVKVPGGRYEMNSNDFRTFSKDC